MWERVGREEMRESLGRRLEMTIGFGLGEKSL